MTASHKRIRLSNGVDAREGFDDERRARAEALLVAAREDGARARELVDEGADAWYQDEAGWTALHHAACACAGLAGRAAASQTLRGIRAAVRDVELVRHLLRRGAVWQLGAWRSL